MKSVKSMMLTATLFCFILFANSVVAETGFESDPEDDVIVYETVETTDQNGNPVSETSQSVTSDLPSADIIEVSYERVDDGTEVQIMFKVNPDGKIEDLNLSGIEDMDYDQITDFIFNSSDPIPFAYGGSVITNSSEYQIIYSDGNCTVNGELINDFTVEDNEFSATFDLTNANEVITDVAAQSMFLKFSMDFSGDTIGYTSKVYIDSAPDSYLYDPEIVAESDVESGKEVQFTGQTSSFSDFFDYGTGLQYTYEWDMDDDGVYEKTGKEITHTFQYPGTYTVNLKVSDDQENEQTTSKTITVSEGSSSDGDNNPIDNDGNGNNEGNPILIFIAIIGIIVVIGIVALIVVIRR